ncbi:YoaK family protein [Gemmiger sp.]|uniref:YoaK family protein n=1 Tax=Gemmiger sp. TaxID=2049027 RepID=UPI003016EC87
MASLFAAHHGQMSDAFRTTIFLTLSGGFQDAYTYMGRGHVFANAQTGNIVLCATHLCEGELSEALRYLTPLLAFAAGVYFAEWVRRHWRSEKFHWRQFILLLEILFLLVVGFVPEGGNALANALVSFVCAMQVQSFRKVHGNAYASTMCIGNLRSGMHNLYAGLHGTDRTPLHRAAQYFGVIGLFAVGAAAGSLLTMRYGFRVIWCCCALLAVSLGLMFIREEESGSGPI